MRRGAVGKERTTKQETQTQLFLALSWWPCAVQIHSNMISFLLHVNEEDEAVQVGVLLLLVGCPHAFWCAQGSERLLLKGCVGCSEKCEGGRAEACASAGVQGIDQVLPPLLLASTDRLFFGSRRATNARVFLQVLGGSLPRRAGASLRRVLERCVQDFCAWLARLPPAHGL